VMFGCCFSSADFVLSSRRFSICDKIHVPERPDRSMWYQNFPICSPFFWGRSSFLLTLPRSTESSSLTVLKSWSLILPSSLFVLGLICLSLRLDCVRLLSNAPGLARGRPHDRERASCSASLVSPVFLPIPVIGFALEFHLRRPGASCVPLILSSSPLLVSAMSCSVLWRCAEWLYPNLFSPRDLFTYPLPIWSCGATSVVFLPPSFPSLLKRLFSSIKLFPSGATNAPLGFIFGFQNRRYGPLSAPWLSQNSPCRDSTRNLRTAHVKKRVPHSRFSF